MLRVAAHTHRLGFDQHRTVACAGVGHCFPRRALDDQRAVEVVELVLFAMRPLAPLKGPMVGLKLARLSVPPLMVTGPVPSAPALPKVRVPAEMVVPPV